MNLVRVGKLGACEIVAIGPAEWAKCIVGNADLLKKLKKPRLSQNRRGLEPQISNAILELPPANVKMSFPLAV